MLASNTSALSISQMAKSLRRPQNLVGLHFFNPVWSMPLLEIVRGSANPDEVIDAAREIGRLIGKETIVVNDYPGFATSRLGVALGLEAIRMLEDDVAAAEDIDQAMVLGYRHPMGPLRLTDLVGLDVRLHIARQLADSLGPRFTPPQLLIDKVAAGELGKKSGRGFYRLGCSMTIPECLRVTESDGVVEITLDRPAERNAIDARMVAELHAVCEELERHPRPAIITGGD